ncbi:MAG: histidine kinase [Bacteroidetes bacterium]|nr:MAG: histidine kinase [Bacteroidota bacterium]PIE88665.1 MAG: histidine kinase [Bacteroidota bacterium]
MPEIEQESLFRIDKSACVRCYNCMRSCPVNAIVIEEGKTKPSILEKRCIGCGRCFVVCDSGAVSYRNSVDEVDKFLQGEEDVIALLGPSIAAEFTDITDYRKLVAMIQALGFSHVQDVSFGVDLVAKGYAEFTRNFKGKYYLFANCPVVVNLVKKYHPDLLGNIAPLVSPPVAAAGVVREKYKGKDVKVVYFGPCIASKDEIGEYHGSRAIDANITFLELRELFKRYGIDEKNYEYEEFDEPLGYKGALYPISNGILQAGSIDESLLSGNVISADGHNDVMEAIEMFEKQGEEIKHHLNLFFCEGCVMGPGMQKRGEKFYRMAMITDFASRLLQDFDYTQWQKDIEHFQLVNLHRTFVADDQRLEEPPEEEIARILALVGKKDAPNDSGCGMCGFRSYREFAVMVSHGLAEPEMCVDYALRVKEERIKILTDSNRKLARDQRALLREVKESRQEINMAREARERAEVVLFQMNAGVVIVDHEFNVVESNQAFIDMLGEETREIAEIVPGLIGADLKTLLPHSFHNVFNYVFEQDQPVLNKDIQMDERLLNISVFPVRSKTVVGAIVRDMFRPEVQQEEVINRMTEVIDENLAMVQKIGFLLGEGASKTEKMLNSIIQSYTNKK